MTKQMLIDASHPEETRVVVVDGKRVEEFDFESASRKPLKGNIYLARVTRVEPSLQAAFVEYGGNRHGFLAFGEIHPDYYRIPVADREALERALAEPEEPEERHHRDRRGRRPSVAPEIHHPAAPEDLATAQQPDVTQWLGDDQPYIDEAPQALVDSQEADLTPSEAPQQSLPLSQPRWQIADERDPANVTVTAETDGDHVPGVLASEAPDATQLSGSGTFSGEGDLNDSGPDLPGLEPEAIDVDTTVEIVGGGMEGTADVSDQEDSEDDAEDRAAAALEARRARFLRKYKIQEVIKRRQIMLIQVTKEERGNKGAALTTYLSLAGRYCVLMPNTPRGGGVSRKITSQGDRKRLKVIVNELDVPEGMAVIVRTAGSERSKPEIRRDYEYLLRLWTEIRDLTLRSTAPSLIYEEGNLIKRSIRDLYSRDVDGVTVEGEEGYKIAKNFMRTLMPSHAKRVQIYRDTSIPLFQKYQIESQLDAIHNPVVQLKSGGYIVINSTEALVAIDVNSGRSTKEKHIEETALKTNLEAAEEVARQLRLRDLAGLVVIDFIDMEDARHNAAVERRLKESMRHDRARIQMSRISPFGLLELSRQRLRPSLVESSTEICRHCHGTGHVRSTESTALHVLRAMESEALRQRSIGFAVSVPTAVALYMLNHKRRSLADIEARTGARIYLQGDDGLIPPEFRLERLSVLAAGDDTPLPVLTRAITQQTFFEDEADLADAESDQEAEEAPEAAMPDTTVIDTGAEEPRRRDRRGGRNRRRGGGGREAAETPAMISASPMPMERTTMAADAGQTDETGPESHDIAGDDDSAESQGQRRRRRGRRGGRRRRRGPDGRPMDQTASSAADMEMSTTEREEGPQPGGPQSRTWQPQSPAMPAAPGPVPMARQEERQKPDSSFAPQAVANESTAADADAADKSKRRGWWSRLVQP